jgi:hypothetical protein
MLEEQEETITTVIKMKSNLNHFMNDSLNKDISFLVYKESIAEATF